MEEFPDPAHALPAEPETSARPAAWKVKVEETRGQRVTFLYDRGEGA